MLELEIMELIERYRERYNMKGYKKDRTRRRILQGVLKIVQRLEV